VNVVRTRILVAAFGLLVSLACTSGPPPPPGEASAIEGVEEWRAARERLMHEDPESPIPEDKRDALLPLRYYAPDASYIVPAELDVSRDRPVLEMPTSTGTLRKMERVGTLRFSLHGQPMTLQAFVEAGQPLESLFVPFADMTTGIDTYAAGRYLDILPTPTGLYEVDFNPAYNPSCAYNERYECPYPPASNRLKVAVRAGEKVPGA
jgi:uncharacterized protein (DUF1684 family)